MVFILVISISIISVVIGKALLGKWLNHLTLYCVIWSGLILLYELKLLPYPNISARAWFYIITSYLSFLFGILTLTSARNLYNKKTILNKSANLDLKIFKDGGKAVKYALLFTSAITIYTAIQNWMVLIKMFGSIPAVILNANYIYILNSKGGGIKGMVPFIAVFGYVAIFFSGIYTAYKGKFTFLTFLPFIGIIVREMATVGRVGMLLALLEFLFVFFLFRHLLNNDSSKRFKFSKTNAIISFAFILALFIASASIVRVARGGTEKFVGASQQLSELKGNFIISPTVYLYLSSDVGVLSKYFDYEPEKTKFGQNTFLTVYHILSKFDIIDRPSDYQKGYFIPMWTNTATYIREIHADFGVTGVFLIPYLLGLIITWLWFKFYEEKSLIVFTILVFLYLIIGFSFLVMFTRVGYWSISQLLIIISIPLVEKIAVHNYKK